MKLILQAIKSLFWKLECKINKININNNETIKSLQAELKSLQEQSPLMINLGYDPAEDATICDTPYAEIEEAYFSGRPVMMNHSTYASICKRGKYIGFIEGYFNDGLGTTHECGIRYTIIKSSELVNMYIKYLETQ